jgi:hypothetical protein
MKMNKREQKLLGSIQVGTENEIVANRFSGEKVSLCPEAVAVYDVLIGCDITLMNKSEISLMLGHHDETYELFHAARDVFRKNWPKEFMILLD